VSNLHNPPDRSQQVLVPILRSSVRDRSQQVLVPILRSSVRDRSQQVLVPILRSSVRDRSQQVLVPILRSSVRVTAKLAICKLPPMCICRTWIQFLPEARIRATRVPARRACRALSRDIQFVEIRRYSEDVYIPVPCFLSVPFHSMKPIISHMCLLLRCTQLADYTISAG